MSFTIESVKVPAGEYYVGDPCYGVPNDRWMEWLEAANYQDEPRVLVAELDDKVVVGVTTAYGDGCYFDNSGHDFPVDAGLIGVVPVELVEDEPFGMHRMFFTNDFVCAYDNGEITIGHLVIDTDPDIDEDEDYDYEDDEDEEGEL
jgi:hypothetical protein